VFTHEESQYLYWNTIFKGLFRVLATEDYKNIPFNIYHDDLNNNHKYLEPPYKAREHILLKGNYQTFKYIDDTLRDKMINIVYSNEDIMYPAYYKYRDILNYFGNNTKDDDMVSLHIRRTDYLLLSNYNYNLDMSYYKEAMTIANKKNIVIFSDDIEPSKKEKRKTVFYKHFYMIYILYYFLKYTIERIINVPSKPKIDAEIFDFTTDESSFTDKYFYELISDEINDPLLIQLVVLLELYSKILT
jgi:hypothetical protein